MKRRISNGLMRKYRNAPRERTVRLLTPAELQAFTGRIDYVLDRRVNPVRVGYGKGDMPIFAEDR